MMGNETFDELFLTDEEQMIHDLKKLEKEFIVPEQVMMLSLKKDAKEALLNAEKAVSGYLLYRERIGRK